MRKIMMLFAFFGLLGMQMFAQKTITGTVTKADDGATIPGVSVVVKGTTIASVTNVDGKYSLNNVPDDAETLVFSYMGMETQEVAIAGDVVDCALQASDLDIGDVVITALGIPRDKRSVGTSVQDVSGDDLTRTKQTNFVNALSGKVAGVNIISSSGAVGASTRIVLRGETSLVGNNQPLFVIDGVPIDNSNYGTAGNGGGYDLPNGAGDINPDDIESISVLKGANAAALYGSRAANGVIIIKTKSGGTNGLGVSISSSAVFEQPLRTPIFQNSYGGGSPTFYEWIDGSTGNGGTDESWGLPLDIGLEATQFTNLGASPTPFVSHPNNVADIYNTGMQLTNSVALSDGSDNYSYRLSYTNSDQQGILPNTGMQKNTFNANASANLTDKLSTSFTASYGISEGIVPMGGYTNENPIQQTIWSQRQVDFDALRDYENLALSPDGTAAAGTPLNWNTRFQNNPFWALDKIYATHDKNRLIGNLNVTYKFSDCFTLQVNSGTDYYTQLNTERRPKGSNEKPDGYYSEIHRTRFENNTSFLGMFKKTFGDIDVSMNVGGNTRYQRYIRMYGEAPALELNEVYNLSNVKSGTNPVITNYFQESKVNSLYFSGELAYGNFVYFDFTGRNDWSSLLPEKSNSFFYPSVSLSLIVTDMLDMSSDVLSYLKLRGGWAKVGSEGALNPYSLTQVYKFRSNPWGSVLLPYNPETLNNPNLISETTRSWETGLDAKLFNGKISLSVTYYNTLSSDLIIPVQVSASSGYTSTWQNIGSMSNKGIEALLSFNIIDNNNFTWNTSINVTKSVNNVESLGGLDVLVLGGQWNMDLQAIPGQPYGSIVGSHFLRSPDGKIIYEGGFPQYTTDTKPLGNIQPTWRGGLENTFSFKGITAKVLFDAKIGGDIYTMTYTWGRYAGILYETIGGREAGLVGDGVIQVVNGTDTSYVENNVVVPSQDFNYYTFNNNVVESSVFDASFVKLRQASIGYTFDNFFNLPIRSFNVSIVGNNLAILYSNILHIDPETAFSSDNAQQGMEFGQIPSTRSVGFSINFKF